MSRPYELKMHQKFRHAGFTLVETILVLGVVGLIVGAIWLGYSAATHVKHQTIGEQQITDILQTARNYMLQANENNCTAAYYGNPCNAATGNDITAALINNNLIPESITSTPNNTFSVEYGTVTVRVYNSAANPFGSGPAIGLIFTNSKQFSPTDCTDIISTWAGSPDRLNRSGIIALNVDDNRLQLSPGGGATRLDAAAQSVTTSNTACNAYDNDIQPLSLYFRLNP